MINETQIQGRLKGYRTVYHLTPKSWTEKRRVYEEIIKELEYILGFGVSEEKS